MVSLLKSGLDFPFSKTQIHRSSFLYFLSIYELEPNFQISTVCKLNPKSQNLLSFFLLLQEKKYYNYSMSGFEHQVKQRARELKHLLKKGVRVVSNSCKKGWFKVKHIRR
ncbi:hypothetical protein CsatA_026441 [Cannabis sativa]|uniref:Uncharacterized protein n=1 Tax=Cannabis sativa TaxID=3483 RepID=A0A803R7X2_CANSA